MEGKISLSVRAFSQKTFCSQFYGHPNPVKDSDKHSCAQNRASGLITTHNTIV